MKCQCGSRAKCVDSREIANNATRRRYNCSCGARFSTVEQQAELRRGNASWRKSVAVVASLATKPLERSEPIQATQIAKSPQKPSNAPLRKPAVPSRPVFRRAKPTNIDALFRQVMQEIKEEADSDCYQETEEQDD